MRIAWAPHFSNRQGNRLHRRPSPILHLTQKELRETSFEERSTLSHWRPLFSKSRCVLPMFQSLDMLSPGLGSHPDEKAPIRLRLNALHHCAASLHPPLPLHCVHFVPHAMQPLLQSSTPIRLGNCFTTLAITSRF